MQRFIPCADPTTFTMMVGFPCGSIHEDSRVQGISHLLEHMMFRSTSYKASVALIRQFVKLGVVWNAYTHMDCTMYFVRCPIESGEKVARLLLHITRDLDVSEAEFKVEKRIVLEELALDNDHKESIFDMMFKDTPYGASIIGDRKSLNAISLPILKEYHKTHYGRPFILVSCNKQFFSKVKPLLENPGPSSVILPINMVQGKEFTSEHRIVLEDDSEHGSLAYLGYPASDPRSSICKFIAFILVTRLFREVREKRGLVYSIRVKYSYFTHLGFLLFNFRTKSSTIPVLLKLVKQEIENLMEFTPAKFKSYLAAYHKQKSLNAASGNVVYLERVMIDALRGYNEYEFDLAAFKGVCKEMFVKKSCAFKLYTKYSLALCLENVVL